MTKRGTHEKFNKGILFHQVVAWIAYVVLPHVVPAKFATKSNLLIK